eukprot:3053995-Pleurochrysis_carterae.AAC.1
MLANVVAKLVRRTARMQRERARSSLLVSALTRAAGVLAQHASLAHAPLTRAHMPAALASRLCMDS